MPRCVPSGSGEPTLQHCGLREGASCSRRLTGSKREHSSDCRSWRAWRVGGIQTIRSLPAGSGSDVSANATRTKGRRGPDDERAIPRSCIGTRPGRLLLYNSSSKIPHVTAIETKRNETKPATKLRTPQLASPRDRQPRSPSPTRAPRSKLRSHLSPKSPSLPIDPTAPQRSTSDRRAASHPSGSPRDGP